MSVAEKAKASTKKNIDATHQEPFRYDEEKVKSILDQF